jgi:amino acid permease
VVNGITGKIAGEYPLSWIKVALTALFVLIVVLIIAGMNHR